MPYRVTRAFCDPRCLALSERYSGQRLTGLPESSCIGFASCLTGDARRSHGLTTCFEQSARTIVAAFDDIGRCGGIERWQRAGLITVQQRIDRDA